MRIASLLASGTEIVWALGLGDHLVAISHECDYPPEALSRPRVSRSRFQPDGWSSRAIDQAVRRAMQEHGSVYLLDQVQLAALKPDLILAQAVCQVCAVPTSLAEAAARALAGRAQVVSLDAHDLEGIWASIAAVGRAAGVAQRAEHLVAELRSRVARVARQVEGAQRPGVLALEWLDPPFVPGHWVPEMIEVAGGRCLAGTAGRPSRQVSWDQLADLDPEVLIVMPCGFGLEAAQREAATQAARLVALAPRAFAAGRAFVVDGSSYFNRSGPRVAEGVEILGALLHPDRVAGVALAGRAVPCPVQRSASPRAPGA